MRRLASSILAGALLLGTALGQSPARWTDLTAPSGFPIPQLASQGKIVTFRDAGELQIYSAFTRRWISVSAQSSAPVRLNNDCLLVRDGTLWTAFSSYTGHTATLSVSTMAQLVNPGNQRNDSILLVVDGGQLHAFSCFVGAWTSRPLTGPYDIAVQRHVALLRDGNTLSGFDAYTGQWRDQTVASTPTNLSCDGTAGLAIGANEVHGFSALHGVWQSATIPSGAAFVRTDDWGLFHGPTEMLAYSALQGTFASLPFGAFSVLGTTDLLAVIDTPAGILAWSAPRAAFSAPLAQPGAGITLGTAVAVFVEGPQVTGYSAVLDAATSVTLDITSVAATNVIAAVTESGTSRPWCFSALVGAWHLAPGNALSGQPLLTTTSALLQSNTGAYAFSGRTGAYVPLVSSAPTLYGNDQSATGIAVDATHFHAFDARASAWRSIPRLSAVPPQVQIWRTSALAVDDQTVHGFGAQNGTWASHTLAEPFVSTRTGSETGRVLTATHLLCHSPVPLLLSYGQFPEFRRVQPAGIEARFSLHLAGGGIGAIAGGFFAPAPTPIPGLGPLWIGPPLASIVRTASPQEERIEFSFPTPSDPALVGLRLVFQALALPNGAPPFLTDAATIILL